MKIKLSGNSLLRSNFLAFVLVAGFALLILSCQSGELSRSQAESMIEASADLKQPSTIGLIKGPLAGGLPGLVQVTDAADTPEQAVKRAIEEYKNENPEVNLAFHLGLVTAEVSTKETAAPKLSSWGDPVYWKLDEKFLANDKAKAYWKQYDLPAADTAIPTAKRKVVEITGMTKQGETQASAEFKYKWIPNEFGKYFDASTNEFKSLPIELQEGLEGKPSRNGGGNRKQSLAALDSIRNGQAQFQKYDDGWRLTTVIFR